jgi:hypothetical protein
MSREARDGRYEDPLGNIIWLQHGKLHRDDGPAVEDQDGSKEWWINGIKLTEEQFNHELEKKVLNEKLHSTLAPRSKIKRGKI